MRVVFTSDLHIDASEKHCDAVSAIADAARKHGPDVVVIAGDAGNTIAALEETLSCFSRIDARKFFVPGNHDVWIETEDGVLIDSRAKYAKRIPDVCRRMGFHDLGQGPFVAGGVGFVGSLGWYDYSFADPRLGLTEDAYWRGRYGDEIWWDKKMTYWMPSRRAGAAVDAGDLPAERMRDPELCEDSMVRGALRERMRDAEVCSEMGARLEGHLRAIEGRVDTIVAVIHTLPFLVGLQRSDPPYYLDAYTGSERLGRILEAHPKVEHCIHGHKHLSGEWTVGRIRVYRRTLGRIDEDADIEGYVAKAIGLIDV